MYGIWFASIILTIGWGLWIVLTLIGVGLFITSLVERRRRPMVLSVIVFAPLLAIMLIPLVISVPAQMWIVFTIIVIMAVCVLAITLPIGSIPRMHIANEQELVDERDAVFHRFYRLEPGTPEYKAYYQANPEKEDFDRRVRNLPKLAGPGSATYDPLTSNFVTATFDVLDTLTDDIDWQPKPVDDRRIESSAGDFTLRIKGFSKYLGAALVGTTQLNPAYVYSHAARKGPWGQPIDLDHPNSVVVAVEMIYEMIRHSPHVATTTESANRYFDAAKIALIIARYINLLGYEARAHVDGNYKVMCTPIAVDAGLGEVGRMGVLINPKYGPRLRLAVVTTDLPLTQDAPVYFGVQDFCEICKKCAVCCPSQSVDAGVKHEIKGVQKWQIDGDTCYQFWRQRSSDCAICMRVCPYSHPRTIMHNIVRWVIKRNSLARRLALLGDDLFYGRKPLQHHPLPQWHQKSEI